MQRFVEFAIPDRWVHSPTGSSDTIVRLPKNEARALAAELQSAAKELDRA